jgi:ankyrin repeat protein
MVGGGTPLHDAAMSGHADIVKLLIGSVADINVKDNNGFTPLRVADLSYRTETAKLLKAAGAKK